MHLLGYTRTSKQFEVGEKFALKDLRDNQEPVIFEINFQGKIGLFELTSEYTAFPSEDEVLIQDGLQYSITDKDYITLQGKQVCLIKFAYPVTK